MKVWQIEFIRNHIATEYVHDYPQVSDIIRSDKGVALMRKQERDNVSEEEIKEQWHQFIRENVVGYQA